MKTLQLLTQVRSVMITQELICNKSCQRDSGNCLSLFGAQLPEAMSRSCQQKVMNSLLFASKLWFKFAFWSKYLYFIQIQFSIRQCISGESHEVLTRKVMFLRLQRCSSVGWTRSGYWTPQEDSGTYSSW